MPSSGMWRCVDLVYACVQTDPGVHPASYPMGTGASFPRLKHPGHGDDHSLPSSAKVKNGGAVPPLPVHFHGTMLD
jgi:hypothetical protein